MLRDARFLSKEQQNARGVPIDKIRKWSDHSLEAARDLERFLASASTGGVAMRTRDRISEPESANRIRNTPKPM